MLYQTMIRFILRVNSKSYELCENVYFQVLTNKDKLVLQKHHIASRKVYAIPSGIDFSRYHVTKNNAYFNIVFIGRLNDIHKGIHSLLRLINIVLRNSGIDSQFVIIGDGPSANLVQDFCRGRDNVKYLGFVSEEEKIRLLSESNLMIVVSNVEPFSLVTLEGLASGLPIVTTPVSGPASIISSIPFAGEVSSFSVKKLARAIEAYKSHWFSDKEMYFQEKTMIRNAAEKVFDLKTMMNSYYDMLA
ncbi:MAG: glycosyltransferase family 4 protein [Nitrososphaerota archaeon]|nr:glycosyltransferase family 4 protein [Nitrososphaerota archaeon]